MSLGPRHGSTAEFRKGDTYQSRGLTLNGNIQQIDAKSKVNDNDTANRVNIASVLLLVVTAAITVVLQREPGLQL